MPKNWRDDHEYDRFDDLDISGLAWECLRRNSTYRSGYAEMRGGGGDPVSWALRFPG